MKRYIMTGAPSTGKTTLINALNKKGYTTFEEVSRRVIISEQESNGTRTPWQDVKAFTDTVYDKTINELDVPIKSTAFVDRGLADNIAYLKLQRLSIPEKFLNFDYHNFYHKKVFMLPLWKDIYIQDNQRLQSFEEAERLHVLLMETYQTLGFSLQLLPKQSVEERWKFMRSYIELI
ncbi:Predicted ATPase [Tenacibaculum sp. MAR_2009_124]|uniref:AAA family ATPase n=1 Tax=Tenacibaculum sp. MAR_2009_124 TaxID=1250059 RepID=UPI00089B84DD|nr:AAA family ATPase [Tenacibaculum sp. MAR_2009_124]SEB87608.1 Predicted ATPase [Tenacibaculum sp. MAR_2009_124]